MLAQSSLYRSHLISHLLKYQSTRANQSIPANNKLIVNA